MQKLKKFFFALYFAWNKRRFVMFNNGTKATD